MIYSAEYPTREYLWLLQPTKFYGAMRGVIEWVPGEALARGVCVSKLAMINL